MLKIVFLGTAGAVASKQRDNTSLLIKTKEDLVLIDIPGSIVKKLVKVNIDYQKISCIFITHTHPDHIYGIISLLHSEYGLKNKIDIFCHPKVIGLLKVLRKIFKLEDTAKYPKLIYHKIKPQTQKPFYNSKELKVYAFKTRHTRESLGFRFFFKKIRKTCVFSSDTALKPSLVEEFSHCDYLIHDCFSPQRYFIKYPQLNKMHTSSLSLGRLAQASGVKTLIPIHFAGEVKYSLKEIIKEIKKNFSGKIIIPYDLMTLRLD